MSDKYLDVFGTEICRGNVVLISRAGQGRKNFERGLALKVDTSGKRVWLKFAEGYYRKQWNSKTSTYAKTSTFVVREHEKVLIGTGYNNFVVVISDTLLKENQRDLDILTQKLIDKGTFPADYILGDTIKTQEEALTEDLTEDVMIEISSLRGVVKKMKSEFEPDILDSLGAPPSLKKSE